MSGIPDVVLDEIRPGTWDELDIGAFDALLASMDQAQEVCAARIGHAESRFGAGQRESERWLGVSRRISRWRTVIRPDNQEAVEAARAYCDQVVDDYATARPLHEAVADGRALSLTPEGTAIRFEDRWWVAREDRYAVLDAGSAEDAALIATLERHAAELARVARAEAEDVAQAAPRRNGER
ncbi:hypothetical protein FM076_33060 [Streptomyces albus subsp. chlorinus]|uniref:hypothetical protein n=1 Tax=Streptomyces albus TaxID=1888 RepID=UPI00156E7590|nr:hypothetical protein [Streptomyces albus]NSC25718.1 hypothetical protein [Streptomyces albus subsp. chlorinus]